MRPMKIPAYIEDGPCACPPNKRRKVDAEEDGTPLKRIRLSDAGEVTEVITEGRVTRARVGAGWYTYDLVAVDEEGVPTYRLYRPS